MLHLIILEHKYRISDKSEKYYYNKSKYTFIKLCMVSNRTENHNKFWFFVLIKKMIICSIAVY